MRLRSILPIAAVTMAGYCSASVNGSWYDNIDIVVPTTKDATTLTNGIECMAYNIYHEARGESTMGQYVVGYVTRNRVNDSRYKNDICSVVMDGGFNDKGKWVSHFSWTSDGKSDYIEKTDAYNKAYMIAVSIMNNPLAIDPTDGATHYHKYTVNPIWIHDRGMMYIGRVDAHLIYKWVDLRKKR